MSKKSNKVDMRCKFLQYLDYVTVEPVMMLYMMAFMITDVVEQSFFVYKACSINIGLNDTVCLNLDKKENENAAKMVHQVTSTFFIMNNVANNLIPIVLAFFIGAWSDKRGRKLLMIIGLSGKLYYSLMIVVNAICPGWPLEYIVLSATLPSAMTGADVAIFATAFSYLIDVSSEKYRTIRLTIFELSYLITMPTGIAFGAYLFKTVAKGSYAIMFSINSSMLLLAILYAYFRLDWTTTGKQVQLTNCKKFFGDFFNITHAMETIKTLRRKRPNCNRIFLILLIIAMSIYTFQREERSIMYLYTQLVFNWDLSEYSLFRTYQSTLQDLILLAMVPLLTLIFGWKDAAMVLLGAFGHIIGRMFYLTANTNMLFYIGGAFAAFGPIVGPILSSMVSKIVSPDEKGRAFAILSVANTATPIISGAAYSTLYNLTINYMPESIYILTIVSQMFICFIIFFMYYKSKRFDPIIEYKGVPKIQEIDSSEEMEEYFVY